MDITFRKWGKSQSPIYHTLWSHLVCWHFHSSCEKRFRQSRFHNFIRKIFIVVPLAAPNSLLFRDGSLEVVGNVKLVRIQSIRVVNLLVVDEHFNIGKNWVQNAVYMSNERNWSLPFCRLFVSRFGLISVLLFYFLAIVRFVVTTRPLTSFSFKAKYFCLKST